MRRIERRPQARFDLLAMYNYIADNGGEVRAERYLPLADGVDLVRVIHAALDLERAWSPQDDQPPAQ